MQRSTQPVRTPFQKTKKTQNFYVNKDIYVCYWSLIYRKICQFHTLLQPKVMFQELNHVLENPKFQR